MIQPIGIATTVLGLICMLLGHRATVATLVVTTLFGSAAALFIGSANIQPAHLFLGFVAAVAFAQRREFIAAMSALSPPKPGFWLACLVVYGAITGFLLPRILAGSTSIFPIGTSEYVGGGLVPLGPVSGNLTQTVYLAADLMCFVLVVGIASTQAGFEVIARALVAYAVGNVLFAFLDVATYTTGTQGVLDFMRNATYQLHLEAEVGGMKRIVGSFTEASVFAGSTLGALGFTGTLWLCGRWPALTGALTLISFVLLILSTSSTAILGAPFLILILYATALTQCGLHPKRRTSAMAALMTPPIIIITVLAILLNETAAATIRDYVDELIFRKSTSASGLERASWNAAALQNFLDSWGFGVGLGTTRTSSFAMAVLSHVGLPGALFVVLFGVSALWHQRGRPSTFPSDVRLAARNACLSILVAGLATASTLDLGLLFFVLAGVAASEPERDTTAQGLGVPARYIGVQA